MYFLLFAYLFLALSVSFTCSIMESVLLSANPSFLAAKEKEGKKWASSFKMLKEDVDKPLSAILSLNTVAHTIGAAGVGAQAVKIWGEAYFGIVSAVLTILILVITEIIPKTIGAQYWRGLAPLTNMTIRGMIIITYPLVMMSAVMTKLLARKEKELSTSREEISALAGIGAEEGLFDEKEMKIIQNVMRLKTVKVTEIMTPRVVVTTADEETLLSDFLHQKDFFRFSRIPLFSEKEEHITGYMFRQDALEKRADDQHHLKLSDVKRDILIIPNTHSLFDTWELMLKEKNIIAVIVDKYGGMDGIVTMEDIVESMLGLEITDETDSTEDMQTLARERWEGRQARYSLLAKE
jgi:CBS domain containing-hemolysin-like protein